MSQNNVRCVKCDKPCGYDDGKGHWDGQDLAICGQCLLNLRNRFCAFFGVDCSHNYYSLEVDWSEVDKILSHIQRDVARRVSYIVTDRELYERTKTLATPIKQG